MYVCYLYKVKPSNKAAKLLDRSVSLREKKHAVESENLVIKPKERKRVPLNPSRRREVKQTQVKQEIGAVSS